MASHCGIGAFILNIIISPLVLEPLVPKNQLMGTSSLCLPAVPGTLFQMSHVTHFDVQAEPPHGNTLAFALESRVNFPLSQLASL